MISQAGSNGAPMALTGLVEQIATALVASRLHQPGHPGLDKPLTAILGHLDLLQQETGQTSFSLLVEADHLVFQGTHQVPQSLSASRLVEVLKRWGAAGLRVLDGVTSQEVHVLLSLLARVREGADANLATLADAAARAGCRRIGLIATSSGAARSAARSGGTGASLDEIVEPVTAAFTDIAAGGDAELGSMVDCVDRILNSIDAAARAEGAELDLSRQDEPDPLAARHSVRVAAMSMIAMRALTSSAELVARVGTAALLHDIGRMLLPLDSIEESPDADSASDPSLLEHSALGAEFLMAHADADPLSIAVAFGHHREHRGKGGVPSTVHEHQTSRITELIRIADKFEALTARRPHRSGMTPLRAYRSMIAGREILEPDLFRTFLETNGVHPIGTVVQLSTGESARVVRQTVTPDTPIVRVVTPGSSGARRGSLVDLSRQRGAQGQIAIVDVEPAPR